MRSSTAICVAVVCAAFLAPRISRGAGPCEVTKLEGDPAWLSSFGTAVAISGDYIVVGDGGDDLMGSWAGAGYVFHRMGNTWERQGKIFGADTGFQDNFGYSVAIDGDRIVVGAPHHDPTGTDNIGWAYVFERAGDTWVQKQKLISSGSSIDDYFGTSVSISGEIIVVGAPGQQNWVGRAYVFRWNGSAYVEEASLIGTDTGQDNFGETVSVNGDRLLVGVRGAGLGGAAYVFQHSGSSWVQETKLTASDAAPGDAFGYAVSLNGDQAIVGTPGTDHTGLGAGSAYIFRRSSGVWAEEANLRGSEARAGSEFGFAVSIYPPYALVGAIGHDTGAVDDNVGATFVFGYSPGGWFEIARFIPSDASAGMIFGMAIDFDGAQAIVGALSSAYVYAVPNGPPCIPTLNRWGVLALAGLIIIGGLTIFRRRESCGKSCSRW